MKSSLHSPNPCSFCTYKIRKNNPLHFQHLRPSLVSAHSKRTSTPLDSAVTRPLSLTPVQSTLTKNRGRGALLFHSSRSLARSFALLPKSEIQLVCFLAYAHSLPERPGGTPSSACPSSRRATIIPPRILNRRLHCPSEPHSTNALSPSAKASTIASGPATTPSASTRCTTSTSTMPSAIPPHSSTFLRSTNIASLGPTPRASSIASSLATSTKSPSIRLSIAVGVIPKAKSSTTARSRASAKMNIAGPPPIPASAGFNKTLSVSTSSSKIFPSSSPLSRFRAPRPANFCTLQRKSASPTSNIFASRMAKLPASPSTSPALDTPAISVTKSGCLGTRPSKSGTSS